MTREETSQMLTLLKSAYPAFYSKMSAKDGYATLNLWSEMFLDDDVQVVKCALMQLIATHSGYPPEIADVKEHIRTLVRVVTGEPTDEELWRIFRKAVANGIYEASNEFDKFPPVLKRYCGSPSTLRELAVQDEKTLDSVIHGQFLRQIPSIRQQQQYTDSLPSAMRDAVSRLYGRLEGERVLTPAEENDRRNAVLSSLEGGA